MNGFGEVFQKGGRSLAPCRYELTRSSENPLVARTRTGDALVKGGYTTIEGTISPDSPMTVERLRGQADKAGTLELQLDNGEWLDFQFTPSGGNRVRCSNGPREER